MSRRFPAVIVLTGLSLAALPGCRANGPPAPSTPPVPPTPVNAAFGKEVQLCDYRLPASGELAVTGDARVRVRCRTYEEFGQRPRDKNWVDHWFLISCDVLKVERGAWPDDTLSFVTIDAWPTAKSGIMLDKVWLYRPGVELLFELDTRGRPATIIGQAVLPAVATQASVP